MSHTLNEEQIQDIIDSDEAYSKLYFLWQIEPDNHGRDIIEFFDEEVFSDLDEPIVALMQHTGDFYSACDKAIDDRGYLVLTDSQADTEVEKEAEYYVEEALHQIPKYLHTYFDEDSYISDLLFDGRGPLLDRSDGSEDAETVNGTTYYIYKQ
jgi:hypothetical protein